MTNEARITTLIGVFSGMWLILSPNLLGYTNVAAQANDTIIGFIVGFLSLARVIALEENTWGSWISVAAGIWLIIAPFMLGFSLNAQFINEVTLGIIVTATSLWSTTIISLSNPYRHAV